MSQILYYGGICVMAASVLIAVVECVAFHGRKKKLDILLEREYGKISKQ